MRYEFDARLAVSTLVLLAFCPALAAGQTTEQEHWDMFHEYNRFHEYLGWRWTPVWGPTGGLWVVGGSPDSVVISRVDPGSARQEEVFDVARLREAFRTVLGEEPPGRGVPFASFDFADADARRLNVSVADRTWTLDVRSYAIEPAPSAPPETCGSLGTARTLSPAGDHVAEIRNGNLWVGRTAACTSMAQRTDDGSDRIRYAHGSRPVWSPDGSRIALIRTDFTGVDQTPVVDWSQQPEEVRWVTYPRSDGRPVERNELILVDVRSGRRRAVNVPGPAGQTIELVAWTRESDAFLFNRWDRDGRRMDLMAVDSGGSAVRTVLSERSEASLREYGSSNRPFFLADGRRFLTYSEQDGWRHLYLHDLDGNVLQRLTEGPFRVNEVLAVDEIGGWVYFMAQPDADRPYDVHLCRVRLDGTGFARLTEATGTHTVELSPSLKFFTDNHSAPGRPPRADLRRTDGQLVGTLAEGDTERLEAELRYRPQEEFTVFAADGRTKLWGTLFTPYDFDPDRAYPVLLIVNTLVSGMRNWFEAGASKPGTFAQLGFVTVELSLRGNIGRDRAFRTAFHGRTGCCEYEDAVSALEQLARDRPWMDMSRVGVLGASVSGFFAARFLLQAPDFFRVGVVERAPMSFSELWGGEDFLGLPADNPAGYAQASNAALADRLRGKLLIVSYFGDAGIRFASTVRMIEALIEADRLYDLIVVPQGRQETEYVWSEAIPRYLVEHLRPWDDGPVRRR